MSTKQFASELNAIETIQSDKRAIEFFKKHQIYDYLLVLDFEATCWEGREPFPHEIIEFPVVIYDVQQEIIIDEFQQYVKPVENPTLTKFCTELTSIEQSQVDNAIDLETCLSLFYKWLDEKLVLYNMSFLHLRKEPEPEKKKCVFVTWSDWDLDICLRNECNRKNLPFEPIFRKWIDLRHVFRKNFGQPKNGLTGALNEFGLEFEGTPHRGIDDARNTAKLAGKLLETGIILSPRKH